MKTQTNSQSIPSDLRFDENSEVLFHSSLVSSLQKQKDSLKEDLSNAVKPDTKLDFDLVLKAFVENLKEQGEALSKVANGKIVQIVFHLENKKLNISYTVGEQHTLG